MEIGLFQKQTTNLVMTTELRQAIALLQYSTIELSQFIQEQAIENPLIELEEKKLEVQIEEKYEFIKRKPSHSGEHVSTFDFIANNEKGLLEDLLEQVQWLNIKDIERSTINFLILNLDEKGYLTITAPEVAHYLNIDEQLVEGSIQKLQNLEPAGVGARDLKECLLLQVQAYHPEKHLVVKVITNYLGLFADKKWQEISRKLSISLDEVKKIADCIQTLNPRPCIGISNSPTRYLFPDITIYKESEEYIISMNDNYLPRIQMNQQYKEMLNAKNETFKYINEKYNHFMWLVRSIEQRRSTILKITEVLVDRQRDFLEKGFAMLQPLTLKEIAIEIGMHESTVSRAIKNKIIQTPIGAFEMHRLFTSKLKKDDGSNASSTKVKLLLQKIIDEENKRKPLSDQAITEYLKKQNGITISRRTVAKYREELNILSSSKRKEFF